MYNPAIDYYVIETVCERCGEINAHLTSKCPTLELPLCMTCGEQHHPQSIEYGHEDDPSAEVDY